MTQNGLDQAETIADDLPPGSSLAVM